MDLPVGLLAGLTEGFQQQVAALVRLENRLATVALIYDMISQKNLGNFHERALERHD